MQLAKGLNIEEASRNLGIVLQSYYRRRKEYGGMKIDQAKRLKELEQENSRLKKLVADLSLDNSILILMYDSYLLILLISIRPFCILYLIKDISWLKNAVRKRISIKKR